MFDRLPRRSREAFDEWLEDYLDDDEEDLAEARGDRDLLLDYFDDWVSDEHSLEIRGDGLIAFWALEPEVEHIIGDLPVVLYHHTATGVWPDIKRRGLIANPPQQANPYKNLASGVYLTTETSGPAVAGYQRNAVDAFGGRPLVLEIKTTLDDLRPDPDDADISSGRTQFISQYVSPSDIL